GRRARRLRFGQHLQHRVQPARRPAPRPLRARLTPPPTLAKLPPLMTITREIYEGFQRGELDRWDAVVAPDVEIYSPGMWGGRGITALKSFAAEFIKALAPRTDLVDEFDGGSRAFLTFCMHWHHTAPFYGIAPTGRRGTSVETLLLTVADGKAVRVGIA